MTYEERDRDYEIVWEGRMELIPDRDTKTSEVWLKGPENRKYTKTGRHHNEFNRWHDRSTRDDRSRDDLTDRDYEPGSMVSIDPGLGQPLGDEGPTGSTRGEGFELGYGGDGVSG